MDVLNGLGDMAFAYSFSFILLEISVRWISMPSDIVYFNSSKSTHSYVAVAYSFSCILTKVFGMSMWPVLFTCMSCHDVVHTLAEGVGIDHCCRSFVFLASLAVTVSCLRVT